MRAAYYWLRVSLACAGLAFVGLAIGTPQHGSLAVAVALLCVTGPLAVPFFALRRTVDTLDGPRRNSVVVLRDRGGEVPDLEIDDREFWHLAAVGVFLPAGLFCDERMAYFVDGSYRALVPAGSFRDSDARPDGDVFGVKDPAAAHACGWAAASLMSARLDAMNGRRAWVRDYTRGENDTVARAARFLAACSGFDVLASAPLTKSTAPESATPEAR